MSSNSEKQNMFTRSLGVRPQAFALTGLGAGQTEGLDPRQDYRFQKPLVFNGLLTNRILTSLHGEDFSRLLPHLEPVSLTSGQDVFKFGEPVDFIYFPETAVVSHMYFLEDGSTTGAAIIGNDGILGLSVILDSRPASYWTQVTVGGSALRVRPKVIKDEFARGQAMQRVILEYTRIRLAHLSQAAVCNGRHSMRQRLCTWLLMIHDRAGEQKLALTHEKIAHYLGARRAGVTTSCSELRDQGAISYSRRRIRIINCELLEETACECYRAMKQFEENSGGGLSEQCRL